MRKFVQFLMVIMVASLCFNNSMLRLKMMMPVIIIHQIIMLWSVRKFIKTLWKK